MAECNLCAIYEKRKILTRLYGETETCIIVESFNKDGSKRRLMSVLKKHTENPTPAEIEAVVNALESEARKLGDNFEIEDYSSAYGHYHRHARF